MPNTSLNTFTCKHYNVAILCALSIELLAVRALFEEEHEELATVQEDTNHYALGRMGRHYVVTTCLPSAEYGTNSASAVMQNLLRSFPRVGSCLLVGIGGGVPSSENDIRLGDVVVSHSIGACPAVVQYDMGKILENGEFQSTGRLNEPPRLLMTAISNLKSNPNPEANSLETFLEKIGDGRPAYQFPGRDADILFAPDSVHKMANEDCYHCNGDIVKRPTRDSDQPKIFYGPIGSGNQVMKGAKQRDCLRAMHKILCFEMEAAGVMNLVPCLVIRGICDYADSHKNKAWQQYAAAAAAAYARCLLSILRGHVDINQKASLIYESKISPLKVDIVTSNEPAFMQFLQPEQDEEQLLHNSLSFAKREPSWNPWPSDRDSFQLFQSLNQWISDPNCGLLTVRGARARSLSELPAPESLACHIIQFLRKRASFPVIYTFSGASDKDNSREASKTLIWQALKIIPKDAIERLALHLSLNEKPSDEQLFQVLHLVLCSLDECFVVIEMKHAALAERLQMTLQRAINDSQAKFKAITLAYNLRWKTSHDCRMQNAIMPSIRLRGSQPGWDACWDRLKPRFK
jgi:nucleoside phosphorylase